MNTDKLWTAINDIERQLINLKGELINIDEEITQSDEAYQRGVEDGRNETWETAGKIICDETLGMSTLLHIFNRGTLERIFKDIPPAEAIEKLKAYEEKQKADDEIKVGDEVVTIDIDGEKVKGLFPWVITTNNVDDRYYGIDCEGRIRSNSCVRKTGRHFDVEKLLEEMRT